MCPVIDQAAKRNHEVWRQTTSSAPAFSPWRAVVFASLGTRLRSACSLPYWSRPPVRGGYASLLVLTSPMRISFSPPIIPQTIRRRLPPDFAKCGGSENHSLQTMNIGLEKQKQAPSRHILQYVKWRGWGLSWAAKWGLSPRGSYSN